MRRTTSLNFCVTGFLLLVVHGCGKKEVSCKDCVIIGSDTLPAATFALLLPESVTEPQRSRTAGFMLACARLTVAPEDTTLLADFGQQLSRISGNRWHTGAASIMYGATHTLRSLMERPQQPDTVLHGRFDSLAGSLDLSAADRAAIDSAIINPSPDLEVKKQQCAQLIRSLFLQDHDLAGAVADFLYSQDNAAGDSAATKGLVKGLVFSAAAEKAQARQPQPGAAQKSNPALALKLRNQESIRQSIAGHSAILEGLYKKELKANPNLSGTVYITFSVAPSGAVAAASIKSSGIRSENFLNPLLDYVRTIEFKPIPEEAGVMTFDFPFEFNPEF